jgi:hypothetical protein
MKLTRLFIAVLALSLLSVATFAQTSEPARDALLNWKKKINAEGSLTYKILGFSVDETKAGLTATFYFDFGPEATGPLPSQFVAQPVMMLKDQNGKAVPIEVGKPSNISSPGGLLEKGSLLEDRSGMSKITVIMPETATALRLSVKNMYGENMGSIFLGAGASGIIGSQE